MKGVDVMKKIIFVLGAIVLLAICSSCSMNEKCPAYADNSIQIEQNG